ncbi:MAG: flagellar filament capping protein FliD [Deltaproteobacteria bacterium]|nr:flagellar filament capping protein FliD [Deltaproteobacteria bacterium]
MAGTQQIAGLVSGFDWQSMIDKLIAVDHRRIDLVTNRKDAEGAKLDAWQSLAGLLETLRSKSSSLAEESSFNLFTSSISASGSTDAADVLDAAVGTDASVGTHTIQVLQLAAAEKLQSSSFEEKDQGLGISGEFLINTKAVSVDAEDTLLSLRDKINAANSGSNPTGVTATILAAAQDDYRLVLTSEDSGSSGIMLADLGSGQVTRDLGLVETSVSVQHPTSDGATSDWFNDASTPVGSLMGADSPPGATNVTIAGQQVSIDLSSQSLTDIASSIDALTGVSASVESELDQDTYRYRLDISGTTSFSDSAHVLESLGVLTAGRSSVAQELTTSNQMTDQDASTLMTSSTLFKDLWVNGASAGVTEGSDTITITGTGRDGGEVSSSFSIQAGSTVQDLLDQIETAYGGQVSAVVQDGKISVTDQTPGDSRLSLQLTANNEGGGVLDFGDVQITAVGREREVVSGQDAVVKVDGTTVTRSSNTVDDAITGVTMNLQSAPGSGTDLVLSVQRDIAGLVDKIKDFVGAYNGVMNFINQQTSYDQENKKIGGPLFSDGTITSVKNQMVECVVNPGQGLEQDYSILAQVGVHFNKEGQLEVDENDLQDSLESHFDEVTALFAAKGSVTNGRIQFLSSTRDTQPGTYDLNVTQAADKASAQGTVDLTSGLALADQLTITDSGSGRSAVIELSAGMKLANIVAAVNTELSAERTEEKVGTTANTSGGTAITADTAWNDIDGGVVAEVGDQIAISGYDRSGNAVSATYVVAQGDTVRDLLDEIESAFGDVTATVDSQGRIEVRENRVGDSQLEVSLDTSQIANLDLGTFDNSSLNTDGRYKLDLEALEGTSGGLTLRSNNYGSAEGFSVSTTQPDTNLGITNQSYSGKDLEGTIGGESFIGTGTSVVIDSDGSDLDGLGFSYDGSSLGDVGTLTVTFGAAEMLNRDLYTMLDQFDGYVSNRQDSLENHIKDLEDQISQMEERLSYKRDMMIEKYVRLEQLISSFNSQSSWLSSQLAKLA